VVKRNTISDNLDNLVKRENYMKIEIKSLIYSMTINLFLSVTKFVAGIFYGLSSLCTDAIQTFTDFVTDVFALIGAKISKKRPTKVHPFGFGRVEYITNFLIGLVIIAIGVFILISSFSAETNIPSLSVIILLLVMSSIKLLMVLYLNIKGKKINSSVLTTASKESLADVYATFGVMLIAVLLQFSDKLEILKYSDLVGSILISLLIIKTGIPIVKQNILNLLGEVELDQNILNLVKDELKKFRQINDLKIELIKYGTYFKVHLILELDPDMTLRRIAILEKKIIKELKSNHKLKIKHINIDVVPNLENH